MDILDLEVYVNGFRQATINPAKKRLTLFLDERVKQIKLVHSNKFSTDAQLAKAVKEQKFIDSIIALNVEYEIFMDSTERALKVVLNQYADYINNGAELRKENEFLRDRLEIMDKRELEYIEILKKHK